MEISVTIADNNSLMKDIVEVLLTDSDHILLHKSKDLTHCLEEIKEKCPDILLIDVFQYPEGLDILQELKENYKGLKIILFTFCKDKSLIVKALNMGAEGYVSKDADYKHIAEAIKIVSQGAEYFYPPISKLIKEDMDHMKVLLSESEKVNGLTRRELEVMELISKGYSNIQIAKALIISDKTVKNHVSNLLRKMGFNDRTQVAVFYLNNQINK